MKGLLNLIWLIFGGIPVAIGWYLNGLLCILFVVTIPFSKPCFEIGSASLTPFGKVIMDRKELGEPPKPLAYAIWSVLGFFIYLGYIISAFTAIIFSLGLLTPFALQNFKIAKIALNPYKYHLVDKRLSKAIKNANNGNY